MSYQPTSALSVTLVPTKPTGLFWRCLPSNELPFPWGLVVQEPTWLSWVAWLSWISTVVFPVQDFTIFSWKKKIHGSRHPGNGGEMKQDVLLYYWASRAPDVFSFGAKQTKKTKQKRGKLMCCPPGRIMVEDQLSLIGLFQKKLFSILLVPLVVMANETKGRGAGGCRGTRNCLISSQENHQLRQLSKAWLRINIKMTIAKPASSQVKNGCSGQAWISRTSCVLLRWGWAELCLWSGNSWSAWENGLSALTPCHLSPSPVNSVIKHSFSYTAGRDLSNLPTCSSYWWSFSDLDRQKEFKFSQLSLEHEVQIQIAYSGLLRIVPNLYIQLHCTREYTCICQNMCSNMGLEKPGSPNGQKMTLRK